MSERVTIERGTVQETLVLPLYGRYRANQMAPWLFRDTEAQEVMAQMDYDFSHADMGTLASFVLGMRQERTVAAAREYLVRHPEATVVNLGCGLDT